MWRQTHRAVTHGRGTRPPECESQVDFDSDLRIVFSYVFSPRFTRVFCRMVLFYLNVSNVGD